MPKQDVVLKLNTIGELFNAPDVDPFSENAIDVLGEAALPHAMRQMLARRIRHWHEARLVIQLPPDQITTDLQAQAQAAVRRFCTARIEENWAEYFAEFSVEVSTLPGRAPETTLRGRVRDQTALLGMLHYLYYQGAALVSVECLGE
jgi:hypothetical protein